MDFSNVKSITIPEGEVKSISVGSDVIWQKANLPYLCFTGTQNNSSVKLDKVGSPTDFPLYTSTDGNVWTEYVYGTAISLGIGGKIFFKGNNPSFKAYKDSSNYYRFTGVGKFAASGNIMSLIDATCECTTIPTQTCFREFFRSCTMLTSAPELPATILKNNCYYEMFRGCTALTSAPELPATTLTNNCYQNMFYGCTALTSAPELPATTLGMSCYFSMFYNCSNLKFSKTRTGEYTKAYRIPSSGTITSEPASWCSSMFANTGGTFTGNPAINTTYYMAE